MHISNLNFWEFSKHHPLLLYLHNIESVQVVLPAENGRKAGFFLKLPLWSKKCCGLKEWGLAHCSSSFSTECNRGIITVSCQDGEYHVGHGESHWHIPHQCHHELTTQYLGNGVTPEGDVMKCVVRNVHGNNVEQALDFMKDCIREGEELPVLHIRTTSLSNHSVNLLLHFLFRKKEKYLIFILNIGGQFRDLWPWLHSKNLFATVIKILKKMEWKHFLRTCLVSLGTWATHSAQIWWLSWWFRFLPGTDLIPWTPDCRSGTQWCVYLFPWTKIKQEVLCLLVKRSSVIIKKNLMWKWTSQKLCGNFTE